MTLGGNVKEIDWYALAQSILNHPQAVPAVLIAQSVALILLTVYVVVKLRRLKRLFAGFSQQWTAAESTHQSMLTQVRDRFNSLSYRSAAKTETPAHAFAPMNPAVRDQVALMVGKGMSEADIARICSMPEGAVRILAGFARLQRTEASS